MHSKTLRLCRLFVVPAVLILGPVGCSTDPASSAAGPGVENPAAAGSNSIVPAIGTAGNGGGTTGGGAGAAVSH